MTHSIPDGTVMEWSPPAGSTEAMVRQWRRVDLAEAWSKLGVAGAAPGLIVAVDGRSGSGKSTLAHAMQEWLPSASVVSTDDVAWHHSMFDWAAELAENVLLPYREGRDVQYRPPGWRERGRPGAIEVLGSTAVLLVEGVGSSRAQLSPLLDAAIWVQSNYRQARDQCLARDIAAGVNGDANSAAEFWDQWQREEIPFLEADQPWTRAGIVVAGVPLAAHGTWIPADPSQTSG